VIVLNNIKYTEGHDLFVCVKYKKTYINCMAYNRVQLRTIAYNCVQLRTIAYN
jgi:hypothetical protein